MNPASEPETLPLGHKFVAGGGVLRGRCSVVRDDATGITPADRCGQPESAHAAPPEPEKPMRHFLYPMERHPTEPATPEPEIPPHCVCHSGVVSHERCSPEMHIACPEPAQPAVRVLGEAHSSVWCNKHDWPIGHGPCRCGPCPACTPETAQPAEPGRRCFACCATTQDVQRTHCLECGMRLPAPAQPAVDRLTFAALREINVARCVNGFGHSLDSWSPAEWTNALAGEAGEAANVAKKMLRHRDNVRGNRGDDTNLALLREKLGRELADVVIYADLCAASQGIDLGAAVRVTFNRKSEEIGAKERLS